MTREEAKDRLIHAVENALLKATIARDVSGLGVAQAVEDLIQVMLDNHVQKPRCRCYTVDSVLKYPCLLPEGHTDDHQFSRMPEGA